MAQGKSRSYGFLFCAVVIMGVWQIAESSSIAVMPSSIDVGITEALTVTCGGSGNLPNLPILVSLTLLASNSGPDGEFLPVAMASATVPFQTFPAALNGKGSATFHPRGPSSIQVTWLSPGVDAARLYRCDVVGLDAMWMYSTKSDSIDVSYKSALNIPAMPSNAAGAEGSAVPVGVINDLNQKIRTLFIQLNNLQTMAADAGAQINRRVGEIEKNVESNMVEIKQLKEALNSQGTGSGNARSQVPPVAPVSSSGVSALTSRVNRLEQSYQQMSQASEQTTNQLNNLTNVLGNVAEQGKQAATDFTKKLEQLSEKVEKRGSAQGLAPTFVPVASSGRSGDCCQAVNQLQTAVQAMATNGQILSSEINKLTFWTTAVRDSEFDVSDVYEQHRYFLLKKPSSFEIDEAHWNCKRFGGYLLEIDDEAEFNFTIGFIKQYQNINRVYTGGNDVDKEKAWVFRSSQKPVTFFNWARGQPDNRRRNEDCIYINGVDGKMSDGYCDMRGDYSKFVCEVPE